MIQIKQAFGSARCVGFWTSISTVFMLALAPVYGQDAPKPAETEKAAEKSPVEEVKSDAVEKNTEPVSESANPRVLIKTNQGEIELEMFIKAAPETVANFIGLAEGTKEFTDPKTGEILLNERDGVYKLSHNGSASAIEKLKGLKIQEIFIWKDSVCYLCSNGGIFNSENNLRETKFIGTHASLFLRGVSDFDDGLVFRWYNKIVIWRKSINKYQTLEIDKDIPITDYAKYAFIDRFGWLWVGSGTVLYYFEGSKWEQVLEASKYLKLFKDVQGNIIFNNVSGNYILKNKSRTFQIFGDLPMAHSINGKNYEFYNDYYRTWDGNSFKTVLYEELGPV